jgi:hypothetical protein
MDEKTLRQTIHNAEKDRKPVPVLMTSAKLLKHRSAYNKPNTTPEEAFAQWLGPRRAEYGEVERCEDTALFYAMPVVVGMTIDRTGGKPVVVGPEVVLATPTDTPPTADETRAYEALLAPPTADEPPPKKPEKPKRGSRRPK